MHPHEVLNLYKPQAVWSQSVGTSNLPSNDLSDLREPFVGLSCLSRKDSLSAAAAVHQRGVLHRDSLHDWSPSW